MIAQKYFKFGVERYNELSEATDMKLVYRAEEGKRL